MAQDSDHGVAGGILIVAGILLLFIVIFAIGVVSLQCCFNACYRRAQASSSQSAPWGHREHDDVVGSGGRGSSSTQMTRRGGDPELLLLLRSLPATVHVQRGAARSGKQEDAVVECVVCLAELEDGEEARFLPCCNHGFHAQCVDAWLASRSTCPLCRINVVATTPGGMAMAPVPALAALPPVPPEPATYTQATCPRPCFSASPTPTRAQ